MNKRRLLQKASKKQNLLYWFFGKRVAITIHFPVKTLTETEIGKLTFGGYWLKDSWNFLQNGRVYIVRYEKYRYRHHLVNETLKLCKPYLKNP